MPWWVWLAAGAGLLTLELALIDAQFYLVFLGLAAVAVAVLVLAGLDSAFEQLLAYGALALFFMLGFRRRIYRSLRLGAETHGLEGELVLVREAIRPGDTGRAELHGSPWTVRNVGDEPLAPGARARVLAVQGVTLDVGAD